jgi:hypothetical protein
MIAFATASSRLLLLLAGLVVFAPLPSLAQEAQCFQDENFLVIAQERTDEVGTNFVVRPAVRGKFKCIYAPAEGDLVLDDPDDPLWYAGLAGDYLALTRSTGPDGDVVIYNLRSLQIAVDVAADDDVTATSEMISYWERTTPGSTGNCPEFADYTSNGLGAVLAEETVLDVESGKISRTGRNRCSATQ